MTRQPPHDHPASEEELRADIRFLKNLWTEIKNRADEGKSPALIYHDLNVVERVLRDQVTSDFSAIWVDTEQEYERILRFANRFQPSLVRRVKQSLERTIGSQCPYCTGTGFVKSVTTVCNEIYLEMRKIAKHLEHSDVMLRVHPDVAKALKNNNGKWLAEMEELTRRTVIVKSDPTLHQEQFDIN